MSGRLAILGLALALAACGSSSTASRSGGALRSPGASSAGPSSADPKCGPRGAHTLAASGLARVYALGGNVYGCSLRGSKSYLLGSQRNCMRSERAEPVSVAGEVAAYGLARCGVDTGSARVVATGLRKGRQLHSLPATTNPLRPESYQAVASLVVKSDGAVAWIGVGRSIIGRGATDIEVHRADSAGQSMLDSGAAILPGSLRLRASTLTWTDGGATRRGRLR